MTRLTRVLVFSAFSASSALGQSGVLIGVSSPSTGYETTRYETLWIIRDTSRPLQATLPDLLVPRAGGMVACRNRVDLSHRRT